MLFFSFFRTLVDHEVTVELKNDLLLHGRLKSVDQFLNIKLEDITIGDSSLPIPGAGEVGSITAEQRWPHLFAVKNVFIRGSVVRYVHLPAAAVDTQLLEDATRREAAAAQQGALKK
ncbi:U6 snRNA-associated Sm-like protein LSm2 [Ascobolus immersus RN42]|uniref:LSM complex subunit LSm2 n=1 Tax=Ascobolus immersus RN42 TaxID=1160509 RepID=A0A3N4HT73_ASCIM|nr:U6 snRNA-associated Sm-like protein LSm2 [Ascobolus immersus RN42]